MISRLKALFSSICFAGDASTRICRQEPRSSAPNAEALANAKHELDLNLRRQISSIVKRQPKVFPSLNEAPDCQIKNLTIYMSAI